VLYKSFSYLLNYVYCHTADIYGRISYLYVVTRNYSDPRRIIMSYKSSYYHCKAYCILGRFRTASSGHRWDEIYSTVLITEFCPNSTAPVPSFILLGMLDSYHYRIVLIMYLYRSAVNKSCSLRRTEDVKWSFWLPNRPLLGTISWTQTESETNTTRQKLY